jgi:type IVB pilus formation R64 PilN family outer membrane protein
MSRIKKSLTTFSALVAAGIALGACSSVKDEQVVQQIEADTVEALDRAEQVQNLPVHEGPANVRHHDAVWLGGTGIKSMTGRPLPARFETASGFHFATESRMQLGEVAERITATTGIPVTLGQDTDVTYGHGAVDYTGPLSGFLNRIAANRDLSWRHKDGTIHIYGVETRTFNLAAPAYTGTLTSTLRSTNGGASASTGEGESNSTDGFTAQSAFDVWGDVEKALDHMIDQETGGFSTNRQTGSITVTAKGHELAKVAEYIKAQNAALSTRIGLNVHVLTVDMTDTDSSGVNFDVLLSAVGDTVTTAALGDLFASAVTAAGGLASAAGSAVQGQGEGATVVLGNQSGDGDNTVAAAAVMELVKGYDAVSLRDSYSTFTTSAQPAPMQLSNQRNFVESTEVDTEEGEAPTVTISTDTLYTGLSGTVTPRLVGPGELLINYNLALSDLVAMPSFTTNASTVQLPEIDTRAFIQTLRARSGESIIAAAFEQTENRDSESLGLTSKSAGTERGRKATVILLTPTILDDNAGLRVQQGF